jgi:hypothetical protein
MKIGQIKLTKVYPAHSLAEKISGQMLPIGSAVRVD